MQNFRQRVQLEIDAGIARVQLARPDKRNALDLPMFEAIVDAQRAVSQRKDVRVVILSGDGEDFCAGLDIKAMLSKRSSTLRLLWKWWPWSPNLAQRFRVIAWAAVYRLRSELISAWCIHKPG
jgi:enoyl-CoA hydratase/carnithine racemase